METIKLSLIIPEMKHFLLLMMLLEITMHSKHTLPLLLLLGLKLLEIEEGE